MCSKFANFNTFETYVLLKYLRVHNILHASDKSIKNAILYLMQDSFIYEISNITNDFDNCKVFGKWFSKIFIILRSTPCNKIIKKAFTKD